MKKIITLLFILTVSVNQLHLQELICYFEKKITAQQVNDYDDAENNDSEQERENKNEKTEKDVFLHLSFCNNTTNAAVTRNKLTFIFSHPIYKNPFTQKDIKPPSIS